MILKKFSFSYAAHVDREQAGVRNQYSCKFPLGCVSSEYEASARYMIDNYQLKPAPPVEKHVKNDIAKRICG